MTIDISNVNGGNATTAETLEMLASGGAMTVAMRLAQNNSFESHGGIIAAGSHDTVHITDTGTVNANAAVETYALSSGANTFYFATGLATGSAGQTVTANGGTLTIYADRTNDAPSGHVPLTINDAAPSGATDITLDITSYSGGFTPQFGDMNLQYVDHLAVTANTADGVHWDELPGGGPVAVNIIADRYDAVHDSNLFGTTGNDSIQGGFGHDTVDISQGGHDTLVFTAGASTPSYMDMTIIGFTADNTNGSGGSDVLDFTALGLIPKSGTTGIVHYGTQDFSGVITPADVGSVNDVNVLGFTNLSQSETSTLTQIASAFNTAVFPHNYVAGEKMIFLVASTDDQGINTDGTNTDVYLWMDTNTAPGGHASVNAAELTKIGVLESFTQIDISHLSANSFV